jgi:hypothetical protein
MSKPIFPRHRRPAQVIEAFDDLCPSEWWTDRGDGASIGVIMRALKERDVDFEVSYVRGYGWRIRRKGR